MGTFPEGKVPNGDVPAFETHEYVLELEGDAEDILKTGDRAVLIREGPSQEEEVVIGCGLAFDVLPEDIARHDLLHPFIDRLGRKFHELS